METKLKDVQFMTAIEKLKVIKKWIKFLQSGFERKHFTKNLYNHLHLHCGYIAHYNIDGFYATYFNGNTNNLKTFFNTFTNNYNCADYNDIHNEMKNVYLQYKDRIFANQKTEDDNKFELLKECIKRAETDLDFRNELLCKIF